MKLTLCSWGMRTINNYEWNIIVFYLHSPSLICYFLPSLSVISLTFLCLILCVIPSWCHKLNQKPKVKVRVMTVMLRSH